MDTAEDTSTAPKWIRLDDDGLEEEVRKHIEGKLMRKTSWLSCLTCSLAGKKAKKQQDNTEEATFDQELGAQGPQLTICDPLHIKFEDNRTNKQLEYTSDQHKWIVLYENQRGFMLFSVPYYSSRSLLPRDPPAFTAPESTTSSIRHISRNTTLNTYPMPDPTWRWASKSWCVDMRGEVQHDGFEYNWYFRRGGWRSNVGWLSAGGFVRRRRWIRGMVRLSDAHLEDEAKARQRELEDKVGESLIPVYISGDTPLWKGDGYDWQRLRKILKIIARDGPKIELWKAWLTDLVEERTSRKNKFHEVSEDHIVVITNENDQLPNERPSREWVISVLEEHGKDFHHFFLFSESRMQFVALLLEAGILQDMVPDALDDETRINTILGPPDFWNQKL